MNRRDRRDQSAPLLLLLCLVLALLTPPASEAETFRTETNRSVEIAFRAEKAHDDPFLGVKLDVIFTGPDGASIRTGAFWSGGNRWRARFAAPRAGTYRYRSECEDRSDPGLHGVEGRVEVTPYAGENPLYRHGPLVSSPDHRHLAHADGTPFLWLGDTWWMGLCRRLDWPDGFQRLAADRRAKGFNVIQIVAGLYPDMPPFDERGANEAGFPWEKDYARIRPEYFDAADRRIEHLAESGFVPCIVGAWGYFLPSMGVEKMEAHWRYLIARWGALPVVWCVAGEANLPYYLTKGFPYDDREQVKGWSEVARFVRGADPFHRLLTIHPTAIRFYTARHAIDDAALLDFDMLQTPHGEADAARVTFDAVKESYAARPVMPLLDGEASYEMLMDRLPTRWTRAMFWICMTSGACGHTYGANGIWQVNRRGQPHGPSPHGGSYGVISWDEAMTLPGSSQLAAGKKFLETLPWHRLEPHHDWVRWAGEQEGPLDLEGASWIWFPEGEPSEDAPAEKRFFRRAFKIAAGEKVRSARLRAGADDKLTLWLNGERIGEGTGWKEGVEIGNLERLLVAGANTLAVEAKNLPAPMAKNPAGLIARLEILLESGERLRVDTGQGWRASRSAPEGWRKAGFDDRSWSAAKILGPTGRSPWGSVAAARRNVPLTCAAIGDELRLLYLIEAKRVELFRLEPRASYRAAWFDPVEGKLAAPVDVTAGPEGSVALAPPPGDHDWVLMVGRSAS